jgi:arylformamidase
MEIFDISPALQTGVAVWPGDRRFRSEWTMQIQKGDSCNVSAVTMSVHTGSHVDAPYHFDDGGADIAHVPLEPFLGPVRVVEYAGDDPISSYYLRALDWKNVKRVLFKTVASAAPENRFCGKYPFLTDEGAHFLGAAGLLLVGTDAPSIDSFQSEILSAHKALLAHGVAILENVRLLHVSAGDYELIALPLRFAGLDASPVRAILRK